MDEVNSGPLKTEAKPDAEAVATSATENLTRARNDDGVRTPMILAPRTTGLKA
jgi:hypothetical protein